MSEALHRDSATVNFAEYTSTLENVEISANSLSRNAQFGSGLGGIEATLIARPVDD